MENEDLTRKVEKVEVKIITPIPKFVRTFATKAYLRTKPQPHYNSANSGLDYKS